MALLVQGKEGVGVGGREEVADQDCGGGWGLPMRETS